MSCSWEPWHGMTTWQLTLEPVFSSPLPQQCCPPSLQMARLPPQQQQLWQQEPPSTTALRGVPGAVVPAWCATALPNHEVWVCQWCLGLNSPSWVLHKELRRPWAEGSRFRHRETSPWLSSRQGLEESRSQVSGFGSSPEGASRKTTLIVTATWKTQSSSLQIMLFIFTVLLLIFICLCPGY